MAKRRRPRGSGSAYFDHDAGVWVAVVSLGVVNGKRVRRKVRGANEDAARDERDKLLRAYGRGGSPTSTTLAAYLGHAFDDPEHGIEASGWLHEHGRSVRRSTLTSYDTHVRRWISPLLGNIPLAKLGPRDVRRLIGHMEAKGKSAGYIHLVIRTLAAALSAAVNDRTLSDNATVGVKLPRIEREPIRALTEDARDAILDAVAETWVENPVRVWLGTGLRRGEVLGLDQGDVDLTGGFVRVRISKTYVRAVPVSADGLEALRTAIASAPRVGANEPVFFGQRTGQRMRGDSITHALPRILEAAKLGHLTPHALRHGAATIMLTRGHSIRVIAEQLGHRNPSITAKTYAHVVPESQRTAVDSLDRRREAR